MTDNMNARATDPTIHGVFSTDARAAISPSTVIKTMLHSLPDPVFVVDRQGRYLYVGEVAMRLLDKPASEFIGKTVRDMGFPPGVAANLAAQTEQVFRTGQSGISTDIIPTVHGPRWYDHHYSPMIDEQGEVTAMLCIARDVTERVLLEAERIRRQVGEAAQREVRIRRNDGSELWTHISSNPILDAEGRLLGVMGLHTDLTERRKQEAEIAVLRRDLQRRLQEIEAIFKTVPAAPLFNTTGAPRGSVGAFIDTTERKQAEEALRLTTERFELALQGSSIVVFHQDLDLRYTWIYNPALGYNAEQVIGKRDSDLFARPEDAAVTEAIKREVIRTGTRRRQEVPINAAGVEHCYDLLVDPLRDHTGRIVGVTCAAIDITDRKRAEEALRLSGERFRIAEKASHSFVYDWIVTTGFEERSEGFTMLLGYTDAELPYGGTAWETLIHPADLAKVRSTTEAARTADPPMGSVEYRVRHKNGHWIWVRDEFTIVRDGQGAVQRIVGSIVDISVLKRQQEEIVDLNARLQRSVTEAHHRIKNNLQVLNAMVDMQAAEGTETVPTSELTRLGQHIRTLATIHDLLTVESKVNAGRDTISLSATLEKVMPMLRVAGGGRKLTLRSDDVMVTLKQAGAFAMLVNELVSNALKHGRGDVEVTLTSVSEPDTAPDAKGRSARLEVCDDGPGFPADFDSQRAANTGLELIESLGRWDLRGQIVYGNRAEGGARVVVTFPLHPLL